MAKTLQLQFETDNGKELTLSVDEPRENLTREEIEAGMQSLINSNTFHVDSFSLSGIKGAKVVERNVNSII
ncbi:MULTISPECIES: DUF2922 domain-containing protein [unclassified Psychrobacillus]|uniref:DUF2922 domain-containing protein n=1 Tax=unclassified Psychrobacillus TaxID=2636677 RepID=UPI00146A34AE|nr:MULTISPECIES: DUF2922 domain-containing protein [unclassified Psychrobacillus]MCM3357335.1 DUF2922 domain-containing protein [Psychrobacillus sp. MER TA 171]NME05453.1 DUF2922 domain-containing protein [Psychrobacillus sp. BL-248-WT-3]